MAKQTQINTLRGAINAGYVDRIRIVINQGKVTYAAAQKATKAVMGDIFARSPGVGHQIAKAALEAAKQFGQIKVDFADKSIPKKLGQRNRDLVTDYRYLVRIDWKYKNGRQGDPIYRNIDSLSKLSGKQIDDLALDALFARGRFDYDGYRGRDIANPDSASVTLLSYQYR